MRWIEFLFLWKGVQPYFPLGPLPEILPIENLRHDASTIWPSQAPEFRSCWMTFCSSNTHFTTAPAINHLKPLKPLTIFAKRSILNVWRCSEYAFGLLLSDLRSFGLGFRCFHTLHALVFPYLRIITDASTTKSLPNSVQSHFELWIMNYKPEGFNSFLQSYFFIIVGDISLTLFRWAFSGLLPKIRHTYPTMMKLGTAIPYLNKIQKNIQITWQKPWVLLTSEFFTRNQQFLLYQPIV